MDSNSIGLDKLEKDVQKYNNLPDQKKIGDSFNNIKKKISDERGRMKVLVDKVDNPQKFIEVDSEKEFTQDEFLEYLDRIEKVKKSILEENNIGKTVNMYLELYNLSTKCKNYLENKKMETTIV